MHVVMSSRPPPPALPTDRIAKKRKLADGSSVAAPPVTVPRKQPVVPKTAFRPPPVNRNVQTPIVPGTGRPQAASGKPTSAPPRSSTAPPLKAKRPPVNNAPRTIGGGGGPKQLPRKPPTNNAPSSSSTTTSINRPLVTTGPTVIKRPNATTNNAFSAASLRAVVAGASSASTAAPSASIRRPVQAAAPRPNPPSRPVPHAAIPGRSHSQIPIPGTRLQSSVNTAARTAVPKSRFPGAPQRAPLPKVALGGGKALPRPNGAPTPPSGAPRPKAKAKPKPNIANTFPQPRGLSRLVAQPPSRPPVRRPGMPVGGGMPLRGGAGGLPRMGPRGPVRGPMRRPINHDPLGLDVMTEEDMDFIDDDDADTEDWKRELRDLTGYDPSRFAGQDEEAVESDMYKVDSEEHLSELIAKKEDRDELIRLMKEAKRQEEAEDEDEEAAEEDEDEYEDEDE